MPLLPSLHLLLPEAILSLGALAVMLAGDRAARGEGGSAPAGEPTARRRAPAVWLTAATLVAAAGALALVGGTTGGAFFDLVLLDGTTVVFRWLALGVVALVSVMAVHSPDVDESWSGEYLGLLLSAGVGLMLMAEANHLLMAYVALELVSLSSYLLVSLTRDARSSEAGLKYMLYGACSSGVMLFGMSLLYGFCGELTFSGIQQAIAWFGPSMATAMTIITVLLLVGLAFKISMVPFHMWTPDVYEGAPIPVAAMLSVGPKAAGLALLFRLTHVVSPLWSRLEPAMVVLTILTMTLGNLAALTQTNVKRLLAYSTIAQVGYLLIGFSANSPLGLSAILVYLTAYLVMNLGAFACVVAVCRETGDESIEAFKGLSRRAPGLAACLALFLLSLAGIPPLAGFVGKFLLFGSAIEAHRTSLAVAGILNSAVALYYYVNIIRAMYLAPSTIAQPKPLITSWPLRLAVGLCGAATLLLGLFPSPLLAWLGVGQ